MNQQEIKLSDNLKEKLITNKEKKDAVYKYKLPTLIKKEIYGYWKPAIEENWRLGELHNEWNSLLHNYQGIVVMAPRDHLKTFFFSEIYPLERCCQDPYMSVLIMSSSESLAKKILKHIKTWAKLPRYNWMLENADIDSATSIRFGNGSEIEVAGFRGKVRGGHYKLIILDDVIDSQVIYSDEYNQKTKERLSSEILPMLEPHSQIIIPGTLQRAGDLYSVDWGSIAGDIKWIKKKYDAIVDEVEKKTIFPEKWPWEKLMAKRQESIILHGDDKWFKKEYRNMEVNLLGEIVKREDIQGFDILPEDRELWAYWGWDSSVGKDLDKGDYTGGIHLYRDLNNGNIYIDKIVRKRIGFDKRLKEIVDGYKEFNEKDMRIGVEENVFQYDSVQTLKSQTDLPIEGVKTTKNKVEKYNEMLKPRFANKKVFIKNGIENRSEFINELLSLPRGEHDDMADALCIALSGIEHATTVGLDFI
jgi:predicted phage terminase large subunit-like protein